MINEQGCSLDYYKRSMMKQFIFVIFLFTICTTANADSEYSKTNFCKWLEETTIADAQNRESGIGEYDLIGNDISEEISYDEQTIFKPHNDQAYGVDDDSNQDRTPFVERQSCEVALDHCERCSDQNS